MGVAAGTYVVPILLPPAGLPLLGAAYGAGGVAFAAPAAVEEDAEASTGETSVAEAGT